MNQGFAQKKGDIEILRVRFSHRCEKTDRFVIPPADDQAVAKQRESANVQRILPQSEAVVVTGLVEAAELHEGSREIDARRHQGGVKAQRPLVVADCGCKVAALFGLLSLLDQFPRR